MLLMLLSFNFFFAAVIGPFIAVLLIRWLICRYRNLKKLNCWFCNKNTYSKNANSNSWYCEKCNQYNGFTEDGDYNKEIPEMFTENKGIRFCTFRPGGFDKVDPNDKHSLAAKKGFEFSFCNQCEDNQVIKLEKMRKFIPRSEKTFMIEAKQYQQDLDKMYPSVCFRCCQKFSFHKAKNLGVAKSCFLKNGDLYAYINFDHRRTDHLKKFEEDIVSIVSERERFHLSNKAYKDLSNMTLTSSNNKLLSTRNIRNIIGKILCLISHFSNSLICLGIIFLIVLANIQQTEAKQDGMDHQSIPSTISLGRAIGELIDLLFAKLFALFEQSKQVFCQAADHKLKIALFIMFIIISFAIAEIGRLRSRLIKLFSLVTLLMNYNMYVNMGGNGSNLILIFVFSCFIKNINACNRISSNNDKIYKQLIKLNDRCDLLIESNTMLKQLIKSLAKDKNIEDESWHNKQLMASTTNNCFVAPITRATTIKQRSLGSRRDANKELGNDTNYDKVSLNSRFTQSLYLHN